jgi:hypothetical protein
MERGGWRRVGCVLGWRETFLMAVETPRRRGREVDGGVKGRSFERGITVS